MRDDSHEAIRRAADRPLSRHAGGRARRGREHARSLPARPRRFLRRSCRAGRRDRDSGKREHPRLSRPACRRADFRRRRLRGGSRRSASSTAFSMPKGTARTIRPPRSRGRSAAVRCRRCCRSATSTNCSRPRARGWTSERPIVRAAARRAAQLPARSALRDRPARLRAGRAAGLRGAARRAHADRARQGQQGAARAAQREPRKRRCATIWRCARKPRSAKKGSVESLEVAVPVIRRERPSDAPAFRARPQGARRRGRA